MELIEKTYYLLFTFSAVIYAVIWRVYLWLKRLDRKLTKGKISSCWEQVRWHQTAIEEKDKRLSIFWMFSFDNTLSIHSVLVLKQRIHNNITSSQSLSASTVMRSTPTMSESLLSNLDFHSNALWQKGHFCFSRLLLWALDCKLVVCSYYTPSTPILWLSVCLQALSIE